jgi:hypothetical protein
MGLIRRFFDVLFVVALVAVAAVATWNMPAGAQRAPRPPDYGMRLNVYDAPGSEQPVQCWNGGMEDGDAIYPGGPPVFNATTPGKGGFRWEPWQKRADPDRNLIARLHVFEDLTPGVSGRPDPPDDPSGDEADRELIWNGVFHHVEDTGVEIAQIRVSFWDGQFDGGFMPRPGRDRKLEWYVSYHLDTQTSPAVRTCEAAVVVRDAS